MSIVLTFGGTAIEGLSGWSETLDSRAVVSTIPRRDGGLIDLLPPLETRLINVEGKIEKTSHDSVITALNTLQHLLNSGSQALKLDSDRYITAQKKSFNFKYVQGFSGKLVEYHIQFVCADPYWYSTTPVTSTTVIDSTSETITIASGANIGNCFTYPVITMTVDGASLTSFNLRNSYTTINSSMEFTGTVTDNNSLIIDCSLKTVTNNTISSLNDFSGDFWPIDGGVDNIIYYTGNVSAGTLTIVYTPRWY